MAYDNLVHKSWLYQVEKVYPVSSVADRLTPLCLAQFETLRHCRASGV